MKKILIFASLLLSIASFGSAFQTNCADATTSVQLNNGHALILR